MRYGLTLAALLLTPGALRAQEAAPAASVDPARLTAARELLDVLLPPAERGRMMDAMIAPAMANVRQAMTDNPALKSTMAGDPRAAALFDAFMRKQEARTTALIRDALPGMIPAMARAYARRFDVVQLREIRAFYETPTGRAFARQATTIMSDPDIGAWQRGLMASSMSHVQEDVAALARDVAALEPKQ